MTYRRQLAPARHRVPRHDTRRHWRPPAGRAQQRRPLRLAPVPDQPTWLERTVETLLALVLAIVVAAGVAAGLVAFLHWLSPAT